MDSVKISDLCDFSYWFLGQYLFTSLEDNEECCGENEKYQQSSGKRLITPSEKSCE